MPFLTNHKPWNKGKKCPGIGGRPRGGIPWNKGKSFTQMLGNKHAFRGNVALKNTGNRRAQTLLKKIKPCNECGLIKEKFQMIRHHKNGNTLDNRKSNLVFLCRSCHIKEHREILLEAKLKKYGNKFGPKSSRSRIRTA